MTKSAPADHPFDNEALDRLAQQVIHGQAVFFVGAGFSIDSEGNTANRMLTRLVLRLSAIHWELTKALNELDEGSRKKIKDLGEDFEKSFPFPKIDRKKWRGKSVRKAAAAFFNKRLVQRLAEQYYEANDWFVSAFQRTLVILSEAKTKSARTALITRISKRENRLLRIWPTGDEVAFHPICSKLVDAAEVEPDRAERCAGKALFLDTMGFNDCPEIMGGLPMHKDLQVVRDSYAGKLLPRHRVLARFAREGWCPLTMTTNFDRLLEGAFRLFRDALPDKGHQKEPAAADAVPGVVDGDGPARLFPLRRGTAVGAGLEDPRLRRALRPRTQQKERRRTGGRLAAVSESQYGPACQQGRDRQARAGEGRRAG